VLAAARGHNAPDGPAGVKASGGGNAQPRHSFANWKTMEAALSTGKRPGSPAP
jgi:hypothetical protein